MKKTTVNLGKEVYKQLRTKSWEELWTEEVPGFDVGTPEHRSARVGLVRALGVVALQHGTAEQRTVTREWLQGLLQDADEKIRRYAMSALPKIGGNEASELALLNLLDKPTGRREITHLSRTLDKIGGEATLEKLQSLPQKYTQTNQTEQKIKAQLARKNESSSILLDFQLRDEKGLRIHLRTRQGLEDFVRDELLAHPILKTRFKILKIKAGCVALAATASFSLSDLYQLRTFGSINLVLGVVPKGEKMDLDGLAAVIASVRTQRLCKKLTQGPPRYRLDFKAKKVTATQMLAVVNKAFTLCPGLLNDSRQSPWAIEVYPEKIGYSVELHPRVSPDPRFLYRMDDVPAASHPPLAAAMAQLAGQDKKEVVWDPFCGSGLELIERARLGPVEALIGTDLDPNAVGIAQLNLTAAGHQDASSSIHCCDFRNYREIEQIAPRSISLILTNPPLGRRVRVADMQGLFNDIFKVAAETLRPGGRLVFTNPLKLDSPEKSLKLVHRHTVDLGGFDCRMEKWVKS
jgi:23S rRNA G2445 N2-methylase RlmL